jgi:hypothetical protein
MPIEPASAINRFLTYGEYCHKMREAVRPENISASGITKSFRYPGRFQATTIITDANDPGHRPLYDLVHPMARQLAAEVAGLEATPRESLHGTLHGLEDIDLSGFSGVFDPRLKDEISATLGELSGNKFLFAPEFKVAGWFLRGDAVVLGLMPLSEQDYECINFIRRELVAGPVFKEMGIGIGHPELFHITLAYAIDNVSAWHLDLLKSRLIEYNLTDYSQLSFPLTTFHYSRYEDLKWLPRVEGTQELKLRRSS